MSLNLEDARVVNYIFTLIPGSLYEIKTIKNILLSLHKRMKFLSITFHSIQLRMPCKSITRASHVLHLDVAK
jgi:hypothetical protein